MPECADENAPKTELSEINASVPFTATYLIVRLDSRLIALELSQVRGVGQIGKIVPLPGAPHGVAGLVFFRGGIEAALDLKAIWESGQQLPSATTLAALVEAEGLRAVLLFDALTDMIDIAPVSLIEFDDNAKLLAGVTGRFVLPSSEIWLVSPARLLRYLIQSK